jgi:ketosteroid isomerase-like protein
MNTEQVFSLFATAINHHDVETLTSLMAPEHIFIDSLGNRVVGAASMTAGWRAYFAMCPDYWIRTDNLLAKDGVVLAVGQAGGTINGVEWQTPSAWKAVMQEGKVSEWQVFADNKLVYEILSKR